MRCKNCDYRLWNLTSHQCPECGTPFLPSQYEFVINSIQFCCPHCNRAYYGTGEKGHLVPMAFDCVSCGRHVHMDEMLLLPTDGIAEEQTKVDNMPWLERKERGRLRSWFATIGRALVGPIRLMKATPVDSSVGQALWFGMVTQLSLLVVVVPFILLPMVFIAGGPFGLLSRLGILGIFGGIGVGLGIALAAYVAATIIGIAIWGAVAHGLLRLTGPTQAGAERTFHAICYSSGANVGTAFPCFGLYIGWIWWTVSAVLMVKEAQQVHGGRAALAALTLPVATVVTLGVLWATLMVPRITSSASWATSRPAMLAQQQMAGSQTQLILSCMRSYALRNAGRQPGHAIELAPLLPGSVHFVVSGSGTTEEAVPVGGTTLGRFKVAPPARRRKIIQAAVNALPNKTIAHRLGDFVFTYHGIDPNGPDPKLWLAIVSPDPDSGMPGSLGTMCVGLADGTVLQIPPVVFSARLVQQNALRAKHDLPPLGDPNMVTHAAPAVAGP